MSEKLPPSGTAIAMHIEAEARVERILWEAFLAGFEASAEGFNGEYTRNDPTPRLREKFDEWRKTMT